MITLTKTGASSTLGPLDIDPPLTAGIPESFANPLAAEMDRPWMEMQEEQARKQRERRAMQIERLDSALLDPAAFFKKNPFTPQFADDPEKAKRRVLVSAALRVENGGKPIPMGADGHDLMRRRVAAQRFEGRGADDDDAFHGELVKEATKRRDDKDLGKQLAVSAFEDAMMPATAAGGFKAFRETAKTHAGYDPAREADYLEHWSATREAAAETIAEFKPSLDAVWNAFETEGDVGKAARDAYAALPDPAARMRFLAALRLRAEKLAPEQQPRFWSNVGKQSERDMAGFGRDALGYVQTNTEAFSDIRHDIHGGGMPDLSPARIRQRLRERETNAAQDAATRRELNFIADVRAVQESTFDPVKYLAPDGSWTQALERGAYGIPGAAVTSLAAAVPGAGMAAFYASSRESIYQRYRMEFEAGGMDSEAAAARADTLAPVAALPQVLMEKLQLKAFAGKLPMLEGVMERASAKVTSRGGQFALRAGVGAVEEGMLEKAQDLVPAFVQDVAHGLSADIPDVNWSDGKNGVLDGFWKDSAALVVTMLPLSIFGAGRGVISDQRRISAVQSASDKELLALGARPADISGVRMAGNFAERAQAVETMFSHLDPQGETAKAAVEDLKVQQAAREDATAQAQLLGLLPRAVRDADGWTLTDTTTGEEIAKVRTWEEATRVSAAHAQLTEEDHAATVAYLASTFQAADAAATRGTGAMQDGTDRTRATSFVLDLDKPKTAEEAAAESQQAADRIQAEISLELAEGGDGTGTMMVFGESRTTFEKRQRNTVNQLHQGANLLTLFEEEIHGWRREARATGRLTTADDLAIIRATETVLNGKTKLLPGNFDSLSEHDQEVAVDEAIAAIAKAEVLRTRKDKDKGGRFDLAPGIVSKNLSAYARVMDSRALASFRGFIRAVRSFFGIAMDRAKLIDKALSDGRLDAAEYHGYLDKLLGLSEQTDHEQAARDAEAALLDGVATPEELAADVPFSLGKKPFDMKADMRAQAEWLLDQALAKGYQSLDDFLEKDFEGFNQLGREWRAAHPRGEEGTSSDRAGNPEGTGGESGQGEVGYSLARAASALETSALSRIRDPQRRAEAMRRVAQAMRDIHLQLDRIELMSGGKRLAKSLRKEAAIREAIRADELENDAYARHWQVFSNEEITRIKSQPVHAYLAHPNSPLHGRLMSKSAAIQKHPDLFRIHRAGDYDGADGVSRSVFGGKLMPDQAAQELYDHGLIPHPTPDAMWDALLKEQAAVDSMKEALAKAKESIREARRIAKEETTAWLKAQENTQTATFSQAEEIRRSLAMLDAILNVVPNEVRGKVGKYAATQLARIGTDANRLAFLKDKLDATDAALDEWLKQQYDREFRELLKRARPEKDAAGQKPKGKIGADVHQLFRAIEDAMNLTTAEGEARALSLEHLAENEEETTAAQRSHLVLEANLTRLVAHWGNADSARREAALLEATRIFYGGYMAHKIEVSRKAEHREHGRMSLKLATGKQGTRPEMEARRQKDTRTKLGRLRESLKGLLSFEQVVHLAFGPDNADGNNLVEWERRAAYAKHDAVFAADSAVEQLLADLAGSKYKGEELRAKLAEPGAITIDGHNGPETFSELQGITATLMWRQDDGRRHMEGHLNDAGQPVGEWHYNEAMIDQIEEQLSDQAKAIRLHLMESYAAEYERINAVFRQLYGVDLPRHKNYAPLTLTPNQEQSGTTVDPATGFNYSGAGFTPGALKTRSANAIAKPKFGDALTVFLGHTRQMEHFIAYAPFAQEAAALLNNRNVGDAVKAAAGEQTLSMLRGWVDHFGLGGNRDASAFLGLNKAISRASGRVATAALVGRISVLAIQATQLGAALAEMPTGSYFLRFAKLMTGRLGWRAALNSDFIRRRVEQAPPAVRQALDQLQTSKPSRLKHGIARLGQTIAGADALFTAGTYAITYDYHLAQSLKAGMDQAEAERAAHAAAVRSTERVAQPTREGPRSFYEVTASNPAVRVSWAFASEARQKLALAAFALAKKSPAEAARAMAVTWIVGGVIASLIRAAMRDLRDDDDEEWFDDRNWSLKRLGLSSLTGPLQGLPFIGDALEAGIYKLAGEYLPEGNLFSAGGQAASSITHAPDYLTGERGLEDAIKDAEAVLSGAAPISDSAAAAASVSHVIRDIYGILSNLEGTD